MPEPTTRSGSCLCGSITFTSQNVQPGIGACHCGMCRKWTGGPLMAVDAGTEISFQNDDHISVYNSSDWAERGFCNQCGSHLFYRLKQTGQIIMPLGLFNDTSGFVFDHQIFIDHKPDTYAFANETKEMTEAEVFAMYGG